MTGPEQGRAAPSLSEREEGCTDSWHRRGPRNEADAERGCPTCGEWWALARTRAPAPPGEREALRKLEQDFDEIAQCRAEDADSAPPGSPGRIGYGAEALAYRNARNAVRAALSTGEPAALPSREARYREALKGILAVRAWPDTYAANAMREMHEIAGRALEGEP